MGQSLKEMERLLDIMRALRDPKTGCPWDIEQTHASLKKYVIEEAYEVAETLANDDQEAMIGELGDLLFQVVFHAEIGRGEKRFDLEDIARAVCDKMVARHPHVFGDEEMRTIDAQSLAWESQKADERGDMHVLEGVSLALPALIRAQKLQKRAARVGFDWDTDEAIWDKVEEEIEEFRSASNADRSEELGDILFTVVNLSRHYGIDAETALSQANAKFENRFAFIEDTLAKTKKAPQDATLEEMERLWQHSKTREID